MGVARRNNKKWICGGRGTTESNAGDGQRGVVAAWLHSLVEEGFERCKMDTYQPLY